MISKRIQCKKANDNYARLANYIADAGHEGEKSLISWCAGAWAGDDYALAVQEVVDTQVLNTRTTKEKTYHLVISFRPEDEAKLTPEVYTAIEERFAKALGFEEHQRHCGVHQNTGNLHMHIAYNMIHPERLTRKEPYRDFFVRDKLCRELEQEFNLTIDHGRGQKTENSVTLEEGAARMEAHTGHQSFEGYMQSHKTDIMDAMKNVQSWEDTHKIFADYGAEIIPHGNGLVIRDRYNPKNKKHVMKASVLDRSLSKKRLTDRFGEYEASKLSSGKTEKSEQKRYVTKPLQSRQGKPERDALYAEYAKGMEERKATLAEINTDFNLAQAHIKDKWATKRQELMDANLTRTVLNRFMKLAKVREAEELLEAKKAKNTKKEEVVTQTPYTTWSSFLQQKAVQGSETALDILRSRNQEAVTPGQLTTDKSYADAMEAKFTHLQKRKEILTSNFSHKTTTKLLNILHMQEVDPTVKYAIDKKGTLIFTFSDGKIIRDTGKGIYFSPQVEDRARAYAMKRWGKSAVLDNGIFLQKRTRERVRQSKGMER